MNNLLLYLVNILILELVGMCDNNNFVPLKQKIFLASSNANKVIEIGLKIKPEYYLVEETFLNILLRSFYYFIIEIDDLNEKFFMQKMKSYFKSNGNYHSLFSLFTVSIQIVGAFHNCIRVIEAKS